MGSLKIDPADLARQALSIPNIQDAERILYKAIHERPADADLLCELGILRCLQGREVEAFELLPIAAHGHRGDALVKILANHFGSRVLINSKDFDSAKRLDLLKPFNVIPDNSSITISACLIVKNEEENLARCLNSLRDQVDEIVVVDTGSVDRTMEIAESFNARTSTFPWIDDFSAARNAAIKLATGGWILWIDADEELAPGSGEALRAASERPQFGGFDLEVVSYTDDRQGGDEFRHSHTRFFRNDPAIKFEGRIHEQITPALKRLKLPWVLLEGATIIHHGYRPSEVVKKAKMDRTIRLLEQEVATDRSNAFHWFNLANAFVVAGRMQQADGAAEMAINLLDPKAPFAAHAYSIAIQAARSTGRLEAAIDLGVKAIESGLETLGVVFEACQAYMLSNDVETALALSEKLMAMEWQEGSTGDRGILTHKRFVIRAQALTLSGHPEEALEPIEHARKVDPGFAPTRFTYGAILEKLGRAEEAIPEYLASEEDPRCRVMALKGKGRCLADLGRNKEAAEAFSAAWYSTKSDSEAWLGWVRACEATTDLAGSLAAYESYAEAQTPSSYVLVNWGRALEASGDPDRALRCFAEAIRSEPSNANAYFNCGDLLYRAGAAKEAAGVYEAGLLIAPEHADGWFTLGNALAKSGANMEAMEAYRRAIHTNVNHAGAKYNLGVLAGEEAA